MLIGFAMILALASPASADARRSEPNARIACVTFDSSIGEYGEFVFELVRKPSRCLEYEGEVSCHCTEHPLTGIRWHHWGSQRATANATWHYCGSGVCIYRPARLIASGLRQGCGPVYSRLTMKLPRHRLRHHRVLPRYPTQVFHLPTCPRSFDP